MVVVNILPGQFSRPNGLRMGDQIALCNLIEHIRIKQPSWQFHIPHNCIYPQDHCFRMHNWLLNNTDYLTEEPGVDFGGGIPQGTDPTYPDLINLWNIRRDVLVRRQYVYDIDDLV